MWVRIIFLGEKNVEVHNRNYKVQSRDYNDNRIRNMVFGTRLRNLENGFFNHFLAIHLTPDQITLTGVPSKIVMTLNELRSF